MDELKVTEQIFFTTVRISISNDSSKKGASVGTGFLVRLSLPIPGVDPFILITVSNKHVFKDANQHIAFNLNHKNSLGLPDLGNIATFSDTGFTTHYVEHPNPDIDLACVISTVISLPETNVFYRSLYEGVIADFGTDNIQAGDDVYFVGYPEGRYDVANNLPLLRKGIIASPPNIDFNLKKHFVIDAPVYQGSSGSPVFSHVNGMLKLIGIVEETMIRFGKLELADGSDDETQGVAQPIGLGLVIKASELEELFNSVRKIATEMHLSNKTYPKV